MLTSDEELDSFFAQKLREEMNKQEELSWDTPHINLLEQLKKVSVDIIEQARRIPKRVRIRRSVQKDVKGVLVFGRKGDDYVFKLGINSNDMIRVPPKEALEYFAADVTEKPEQVGDAFEDIYQNVKANLFLKKSQISLDKGRREAVNKLIVIKEKITHKKDYIEDLIHVIQKLDALPERFARMIRAISLNKLEREFPQLEQAIPHRYLIEIMEAARKVEEGAEYLIFAEELI